MATELDLQRAGLSAREARIIYGYCVKSAQRVGVTAEDIADLVCKALVNVPEYKERLRKYIMNQPLVITTRQLQDIDWCMGYHENFNHGADGHNRMKTVAAMARALGFTRDDNGAVVIPAGVTVDDGPATGRGSGT